ncbi:MAG: hypothetical protein LBH70_02055 [Spirochaetaceae bacterium]|nr:hypothetical protein [Spirochaetaceae bacterium]
MLAMARDRQSVAGPKEGARGAPESVVQELAPVLQAAVSLAEILFYPAEEGCGGV